MNQPYRQQRKIDPSRASTLGDGSPNDNNRVEIGPTQLAFSEWEQAGLELPDLTAMRLYRWQRLTEALNARDYGGLLMFDPLNIRYATDSTNMQIWNSHNPFHALLLCADGYMVIWDYKQAPFLSNFNPLVREQRSGADLFYFDRGDKIDRAADVLSNEIRLLIKEHGGGNMRLAVDKIMLHGLRALEAQGFSVMEGEEVTEKARAVKGPHEIRAMRCANHACETSVRAMEDFARANVGLARLAKTISGQFCTPKISVGAENGSKRGFLPPALAAIRGFRNAARGSLKRTRSSRLIQTLSELTVFASTFHAAGGSARKNPVPT